MYKQLNTILLVTISISALISFILLIHTLVNKTYCVNPWIFPMLITLILNIIYYNTVVVKDGIYGE